MECTLIIANGAFFFMFPRMGELCYDIGIEPTTRQASKFKNKKGLLYKAYNENNTQEDIQGL